MLVWRGDRLLMLLSTLGFARCYPSPSMGNSFARNVRSAQHRLYRRARSTGTRSTNAIVGPKDRGAEQDPDADEWDTWEFGSWKVRQMLYVTYVIVMWMLCRFALVTRSSGDWDWLLYQVPVLLYCLRCADTIPWIFRIYSELRLYS